MHDHPATIEGGVRSYLGVPLRLYGRSIGSFCVVDERPRDWSEDDLVVLQGLAASALSATA